MDTLKLECLIVYNVIINVKHVQEINLIAYYVQYNILNFNCKGDRINIPICNCQDGYYDDYQNINCQVCQPNCKTCNLEGCLTCNGNRLLSDEKTCDCPLNSISHSDTPWCSDCEVAVLDIRFSDDLLSIIIGFDFPLNPNYFQSYTQIQLMNKFNQIDYSFKIIYALNFQMMKQLNNQEIILIVNQILKMINSLFYNWVQTQPSFQVIQLHSQFLNLDIRTVQANQINLFLIKQINL